MIQTKMTSNHHRAMTHAMDSIHRSGPVLTDSIPAGLRVVAVMLLLSILGLAAMDPQDCQAAPAFQTFSFAADNRGTSISGSLPAGTTAGDLLIAIMVTDGNNEVLTAPAGWTAITGNIGQAHTSRSWYRIAGSSEPGSYTFTVGSNEAITLGILRISGHHPTAPINISGTATGAGVSPASPSVATTAGNTLVLRYYGADDDDYTGDDTGYPAGHTGVYRRQSGGNSECHQGLAYVVQAGIGATGTASFSQDRDEQWSAATIAIAPAPVTYSISGTVFEDLAGDALPGGQAAGDPANPGAAGVTVSLYRDGGDGAADGLDDVLLNTTVTAPGGVYAFSGLSAGNYWVVVDSRTISPAAGVGGGAIQSDLWAEQTYGSAGAITCDDDGLKGFLVLPVPGVCYGGRRSNLSDNAAALATAEHVTGATVVASNVTGVNSGFSFNVVTDVRDGDDVIGQGRTVQGSLGQFFLNANGVSGASAMRFVPAVSANSGAATWWTVTLAAALPPLTGAATTVSGTAYSYADGTTVRNPNSGTAGHGGQAVGTGADGVEGTGDELVLPIYKSPELEIDGADLGDVIDIAGNSVVVEALAVFNSASSAGLIAAAGTGSEVRECLFGTRADGSDPGSGLYLNFGVHVAGGECDVTDNLIAYIANSGVMLENVSVASGNDVYEIGASATVGDGFSVEMSSGQSITIRGNRVETVAAYGLESWQAPGPYTFEHNTVLNTGVSGGQGETGGIRIFGSGNTVRHNVVSGSAGVGVVVVQGTGGPASNNRISQNAIYGNGSISIDLDQTNLSGNPNGDGVTPNDGAWNVGNQNVGFDYPVFTLVTILGNTLHVEGYVGTAASPLAGTHTLEVFIADDDGNNDGEIEAGDGLSVAHGEGRYYVGSLSTAADGSFDGDLTVPASLTVSDGDPITATATDASGNTSEFGAIDGASLVEPNIAFTKSVDVYSDPLNGTTNPRAIPGAEIDYTTTATNTGAGATDNNTVVFTDSIPAGTQLFVGDLGLPGSGPVEFINAATASGLSYTFIGLGSPADDLVFFDSTGPYVPTPDGNGCDAAVLAIRVDLKGQFDPAAGGNTPSFTLRFRTRVE